MRGAEDTSASTCRRPRAQEGRGTHTHFHLALLSAFAASAATAARPRPTERGTYVGLAVSVSRPPGPGFPKISPGCLHPDNQTDLWCPGQNGYMCYKIPSLLRIPNTTELLAFIEARKHSCDDEGYIDLLLKRSHDNGHTWTAPQMVYGDSTPSDWHTIGDALPVWDAHTRVVHLVFTRDNTDAFASSSDDLGVSWAPPKNITHQAVKSRTAFIGTGHAGGLQLTSGRLLVPMYGGTAHSYALASDDHGDSWHIAGEIEIDPNEWDMAEVVEGSNRLLGSVRNFPDRVQSYSDDGGDSWSKIERKPLLPEPISGCEGSLILHPNGWHYYSHPDDPLLRDKMHIKVSKDMGNSWQHHATIWGPGVGGCDPPCVPAASYSSMTVLGESTDSEIGLLYMRNNVTMLIFEGRGVTFTTFKP